MLRFAGIFLNLYILNYNFNFYILQLYFSCKKMSKIEKLITRFLSKPDDFTWNELIKLLNAFPSNIVKKYAIEQFIENLTEKGKL